MNNPFDLTGKVALVTGTSRGIGQAIAVSFVQAGAKVILSSRKQDGLDEVAANLRANGGDVLAVAAHNGDKAALHALVQQAVHTYGGVDILVNNAATNPHFGPLLEAEDSLWQKTFEVNIMGAVWLTQAVVPLFRQRGGGKIINVASINALRPGLGQGIYSLTKAALVNLTQSLALELGRDNIQVNAIAPGLVKTRFARTLWENADFMEQLTGRIPAGRIGEPEDLGGIARYLASAASAFTTGQVFVVDGGMTLPLI